MQYMTECILGGKPSRFPALSPSFNSNRLNLSAKSSIFDWTFASSFTAFSSALDSFNTLLSLMGLSHLLPLDLGLTTSSSSDDPDLSSEGELEDSELESSTDPLSSESAKHLFHFRVFAKCPLRFTSCGWYMSWFKKLFSTSMMRFIGRGKVKSMQKFSFISSISSKSLKFVGRIPNQN